MIRNATPADAQWILDLWNRMIAETLFTFTTALKSQGEIIEMIARDPVFVVGERAGFATYFPFRKGPGYVPTVEHSIYLDPAHWGQGYGETLLNHVTGHARDSGKRIVVAGISSANPNAMAFHQRMGFTTVGHMPSVACKNDQWLDLILMQKDLFGQDNQNSAR